MKRAWPFLAMMLANCSTIVAQDAFYYGTYPTPPPVVVYQPRAVIAAPPVVTMSYVPQFQMMPPTSVVTAAYNPSTPVFVSPGPVYVPRPMVAGPVVVSSPVVLAASPYSVAARETVRATRNGIDYSYREYGPWGGQRYHYSVNSKPHGYVIRERGR